MAEPSSDWMFRWTQTFPFVIFIEIGRDIFPIWILHTQIVFFFIPLTVPLQFLSYLRMTLNRNFKLSNQSWTDTLGKAILWKAKWLYRVLCPVHHKIIYIQSYHQNHFFCWRPAYYSSASLLPPHYYGWLQEHHNGINHVNTLCISNTLHASTPRLFTPILPHQLKASDARRCFYLAQWWRYNWSLMGPIHCK